MVIAVNGWMNHPSGFRARRRQGRRRAPVAGAVRQHATSGTSWSTCISPATSSRASCVAGAYAVGAAARPLGPLRADGARDPADRRGAGRAGAGARRRLERPRGRPLPADEAGRARRPGADDERARRCTCSAGTATGASSTGSRSRSCSRCSPSTSSNATVQGLDAVPARDRPPVNVVRFAFQTMVGIGTLLALLARRLPRRADPAPRLPDSPGSTGRSSLAGPLSVVALISGWVTTEVGRQPWVVYRVMRTSQAVTGAGGIPVGYAHARPRLRRCWSPPSPGSSGGSPASRSSWTVLSAAEVD